MKSKNNLSEFINANKNTLTFKIWLYFFIFAIALFIILWFMQVIFIQSYYSSMKKSEVHKIAENIENSIIYKNIFAEEKVETPTDAIMKSVAEATNSLNAKLIITPTISGKTARLISTLEPSCPILALVRDEKTANQLSLNYGVYAKIVELKNDMDELVELSIEEANKFIKLEKGDNIIVTGGLVAGKIGFTNLMKIETIK